MEKHNQNEEDVLVDSKIENSQTGDVEGDHIKGVKEEKKDEKPIPGFVRSKQRLYDKLNISVKALDIIIIIIIIILAAILVYGVITR